MKKFSLFLKLAAAAGMVLAASCNKMENQPQQEVPAVQTTDYVQQLDQASKCIKEACDGMDLRELAPVAESLENGPMKDLFSALASTFDSRKPFLSPIAFSRVSDLLAQSWAIRENTVSFPFGENSFTVKTSHGLKDGFVNRGLEISRNDTLLVRMNSSFAGAEYSGTILVKGMNILLDYEKEELHKRIVSVTLQPEGNPNPLAVLTTDITDSITLVDMLKNTAAVSLDYNVLLMDGSIGISGHVKQLGKLVGQAASMLAIFKNGADESVCRTAAENFNGNTEIFLNFANTPMGNIYAAPIYSEELEKYTLTLMLSSPLLGEEPLNLLPILKDLGLDLENIFGSIENGK